MSDFLSRLAEQLLQPLPGRAAQDKFAPALAYGRHQGPVPHDVRHAAVAVILYHDDRWRLPLIVRPQHLLDHPGQVCLPGGMLEPDESGEACAQREAREELGADMPLRILGRLSPVYVFASNFLVVPFVAAANEPPRFRPNADEVATLLQVPLDELLDPAKRGEFLVERHGLRFRAPCHHLQGQRVWGATSMMLGELTAVLEQVVASTV